MLIATHRRAALTTLFLFLGGNLGALEIIERFDDHLYLVNQKMRDA
ncbi:MAG: hypothetical protein M3H12_18745 [Chromatiales bacterium]|nr:hypothetical protein [Gammaproteobacteria bacterium]